MKKYRDNGAIGAFLDEYERALGELETVLKDVTPEELVHIVEPDTQNASCRSIQTILAHVIMSGYWYVIEIRKSLGEDIAYPPSKELPAVDAYIDALDVMFEFNEKLFEDYPDISTIEWDPDKKIKVRWGQLYDVGQMFEHAIVHVLRHRRQIERFILKLR